MGFVKHPNSYLRDSWNLIDFLVVIAGLIEFIPGIPNLKALRTIRVIRPLRSINAVESIKKIVAAMIKSLPGLSNVIVFLLFVFLLFGILGLQQFDGVLYYRCRTTPEPLPDGTWPIWDGEERVCSPDGLGNFECPANLTCGALIEYDLPLKNDDVWNTAFINYGITSFDQLAKCILAIFQIITLEGWVYIMYNHMDATLAPFSAFYFCLLVVVGAFFMLNLILAVIMEAADKMDDKDAILEAQAEERRKKEAEERKRLEELEREIAEQEQALAGLNGAVAPSPGGRNAPTAKARDGLLDKMVKTNEEMRRFKGEFNVGEAFLEGIKKKKMDDRIADATKEPPVTAAIAAAAASAGLAVAEEEEGSAEVDVEDLKDVGEPVTQGREYPERAQRNALYKLNFWIASSDVFNAFITILIIMNTVCLAMDRYPMPDEELAVLEVLNLIFFVSFLLEMIIKILGLGLREYVRDSFNIFDAVIVLVSCVDVALFYSGSGGGGGAISALRGFRLLRIFKLAKSWKKFQDLLKTIIISLVDISAFSILLFLFMFTYNLLGMEFFAYRVAYNDADQLDLENGEFPRTNFNTFLEGITTIFITLTGDSWNLIMYRHIRQNYAVGLLYFVSLVIFGRFLMLNLFLAILLKNFDVTADAEEEEGEDGAPRPASTMKRLRSSLTRSFTAIRGKCRCCRKERDDDYLNAVEEEKGNSELERSSGGAYGFAEEPQRKPTHEGAGGVAYGEASAPPEPDDPEDFPPPFPEEPLEDDEELETEERERRAEARRLRDLRSRPNKVDELVVGRAFFVLRAENKFRRAVGAVVTNPKFDWFIMACIIVSSILLAIENPLADPNGSTARVLKGFDVFMTVVFTLELVLKNVTFGFAFNGENSYVRNSWNRLDLIIVTFSLISMFATNVDLSIFKVLRLLRVLRPLRMISRNEGLKISVMALGQAIPNIINVLIISLLFFLIFGIIGVNYFKGQFFRCVMDTIPKELQAGVVDKWACIDYGGVWVNAAAHFDNVVQGILTLFEMSTFVGWSITMFDGVDSAGVDKQPIRDNGMHWILFFILFILIGGMFILNLFVGVVISTFNQEKEKLGMMFMLTDAQKEWLNIQLMCYQARPKKKVMKTGSAFRDYWVDVVNNPWFEIFIMTCIILNTVVLALKWYGQPESVGVMSDALNYVFSAIFTIEAGIKLTAMGSRYFDEGWNVFDFVIVIGTYLGILVGAVSNIEVGPQTTVIRAFRIMRIFRLVRKAKNLRIISMTFIISIPLLTNVGGLMMLLLFIYAILGTFLFATVMPTGAGINYHANFQNFGNSFLTLIRLSTADSWIDLLHDARRQHSVLFDCVESPTYEQIEANGGTPNGCGTRAGGVFFFVSFLLIMTLVFLNLFIAIILQVFADIRAKEDTEINEESVDAFKDTWVQFDPDGTGFLPVNQLLPFLFKLGPPLGLDKSLRKDVQKQGAFVSKLKLPTYHEMRHYHFLNVLQALSKMRMKSNRVIELKLKQARGIVEKDDDGILDEVHADYEMEANAEIKEVSMVKLLKRRERASTKAGRKQKDAYTSIHVSAGRVILCYLMKFKMFRTIKDEHQFNPDVFKKYSKSPKKTVPILDMVKEELKEPEEEETKEEEKAARKRLRAVEEEKKKELPEGEEESRKRGGTDDEEEEEEEEKKPLEETPDAENAPQEAKTLLGSVKVPPLKLNRDEGQERQEEVSGRKTTGGRVQLSPLNLQKHKDRMIVQPIAEGEQSISNEKKKKKKKKKKAQAEARNQVQVFGGEGHSGGTKEAAAVKKIMEGEEVQATTDRQNEEEKAKSEDESQTEMIV